MTEVSHYRESRRRLDMQEALGTILDDDRLPRSICVCICMHVCMYVCMYVCMHAYMCIYIIFTHTHAHTHRLLLLDPATGVNLFHYILPGRNIIGKVTSHHQSPVTNALHIICTHACLVARVCLFVCVCVRFPHPLLSLSGLICFYAYLHLLKLYVHMHAYIHA